MDNESWTIKKAEHRTTDAFFWTVVLEKTLESPLESKEIKPVNPKRNLPWILIGKTDTKAKAPILWPPDTKDWLTVKTLMLGKIEGKIDRGDGGWMVGWYHWLRGHESEQTQGDNDGQRSLACCSPWSCRIGHNWVTEQQKFNLIFWFKIWLCHNYF